MRPQETEAVGKNLEHTGPEGGLATQPPVADDLEDGSCRFMLAALSMPMSCAMATNSLMELARRLVMSMDMIGELRGTEGEGDEKTGRRLRS